MSAKSTYAGGLLAGLVTGGLRRERKRLAELDDSELVSRVSEQCDDAAFAELVRRHEGRVRGLLLERDDIIYSLSMAQLKEEITSRRV